MLAFIRSLLPQKLFSALQPAYHFSLAFLGALLYRFPSKELIVIGVTGTKGKSTTTELVNAILEAAGYTTALQNTIRFKIGSDSKPNRFKMTMPGRFFMQRFLREAIQQGATHAVIEVSSEAAKLYRHRFLYLDALIFTHLTPEHIESHGSLQNYINAKLEIGKQLIRSGKSHSIFVGKKEDPITERFLALGIKETHTFSLTDAEPYELKSEGTTFTYKNTKVPMHLVGTFNIENALAALITTEALGIPKEVGVRGISKLQKVLGRVEYIDEGQHFPVVVDYAHTAESLEALYKAFPQSRKICVLGNTGGGRDKWKRPVMGKVASTYCSYIILTDEDPYDEDPRQIINDMLPGIQNPNKEIIMDRRDAIATALRRAKQNDIVLITGKGTDPYIMKAHGEKLPWSDADITRAELRKLLNK